MSKKKFRGLYHYFITFPDKFYPFKNTVQGKVVRGRASYDFVLRTYQRRYGRGHYGVKLCCYRAIFHIAGSLLFIFFAVAVANAFFENKFSLYVIAVVGVALISFQEFYSQPREYHQLLRKGIFDWVCWVAPLVLYFLYF